MVEGNANLRPGLAAQRSRNSSIRLRRYPSNIPTLPPSTARPQSQRFDSDHSQAIDAAPQVDEHGDIVLTTGPSTRRARAISEPQRDTTHRHQYEPNPRGSGNVFNLDDVIEERKSLAQRPMDFDVRTDNEKLQQRQRDNIHMHDANQRKRASTVSSAPGRGKMKVRGHEYDAEMVDLLDLVGMCYDHCLLCALSNALTRSRDPDTIYTHQCPKLFIYTQLWTILKPTSDI